MGSSNDAGKPEQMNPYYQGHELVKRVVNGEINPFNGRGGSIGKNDFVGNYFDSKNPYVQGPRKHAAAMEAMNSGGGSGYSNGMPKAPSFVDENGELLSQYAMDSNKYQLGGRQLDTLNKFANSKGASPYAQMQLKNIDLQGGAMRDQNATDSAQAYGQGVSNLAQTGGVDSGARERLSGASGLAQLQGNQAISRDSLMAKTNVGMEDEKMKLGVLQQLPGMYQNRAAFQANIDNKNLDRATNSQMYNYGEQMKAFTGDRMAQATAAAGGGGKKAK